MERFAQYLDDLEDLCYAAALLMERIRKALLVTAFTACFAAFLYSAVQLALKEPPLGLAAVCLLVVGHLYFGATGRFNPQPRHG